MDDELAHYGVKGMHWGVRKAYYGKKAEHHIKKQNKLQSKADKKRNSTMNSRRRRINYATKEKRYAAAEKFHNQKAVGLSWFSKLTGTTLDYKYNKERASKDAVMKNKYSLAKTGTTNKVNRLEYRASKQAAKADKAIPKRKVSELKLDGAKKQQIDNMVNSYLGVSVESETWISRDGGYYKDKQAITSGYVGKNQRS